MAMPKKTGIIFAVIGAVLMLSALLLFFYNTQEDRSAGQEAELLLGEVQSAIQSGIAEPSASETETEAENLPEVTVGGYACIGYLSIPDLELELPVLSEWDYDRLKVAPCRQFGSTETDDLVIAAHNYTSHFGKLSALEIGAVLYFTDMCGETSRYALQKLETLPADAVDAVQNSGYDLVLYTCNGSGSARVTAFCERITEKE